MFVIPIKGFSANVQHLVSCFRYGVAKGEPNILDFSTGKLSGNPVQPLEDCPALSIWQGNIYEVHLPVESLPDGLYAATVHWFNLIQYRQLKRDLPSDFDVRKTPEGAITPGHLVGFFKFELPEAQIHYDYSYPFPAEIKINLGRQTPV